MTTKTEENVFKIVRKIGYWSSDSIFPTVEMKIDSDANLSEILEAFEGFLKVSGYYLSENSKLYLVDSE